MNRHYEYVPIDLSPSAKYLGVLIDSELLFKPHIQSLQTKLWCGLI